MISYKDPAVLTVTGLLVVIFSLFGVARVFAQSVDQVDETSVNSTISVSKIDRKVAALMASTSLDMASAYQTVNSEKNNAELIQHMDLIIKYLDAILKKMK